MEAFTNHTGSQLLSRRRSFRRWLKRVTMPSTGNSSSNTNRLPQGGVFNIPLTMSIKYAQTTVGYVDNEGIKHSRAGAIPIIVAKCGSFLKKKGLHVEGIFRVSGNHKRLNTLEFLFDQSQSNYGLDLNWDGYTVHDAASVLRRYLNKLPEPVIPVAYYQPFRDVMNDKVQRDIEGRIEAFQSLIRELPTAHQHLLLYLLDTLSLFASFADETKMTITNLASVFCPAILRHPEHNTPLEYKISQCVLEFLIEFQSLFTMELLMASPGKDNTIKRQETRKETEKAFSLGCENHHFDDESIPPVPLLIPSATTTKPYQKSVINLDVIEASISTKEDANASSVVVQSPTEIDQSSDGDKTRIAQNKKSQSMVLPMIDSYILKAAKAVRGIHNSFQRDVIGLSDKIKSLRIGMPSTKPYTSSVQPSSPVAKLVYCSTLSILTFVVVYELYLIPLRMVEPFVFFLGLFCYCTILYYGIFDSTAVNTPAKNFTSEPSASVIKASTATGGQSPIMRLSHENKGEVASNKESKQQTSTVAHKIVQQVDGDTKDTNDQEAIADITYHNNKEHEACLLRDEVVRSEWQSLLTRAWKAESNNGFDNLSMISVIPDTDSASIMSQCSRFNEEEESYMNPTGNHSGNNSDDDEEDEYVDDIEDLAFDTEALERYLEVYNQIKNDAQMAKQLQWEEERARDKHNPFLTDTTKNNTSHFQDTIESREDENDDPVVTTPTGTAKEEWKIKIFSR